MFRRLAVAFLGLALLAPAQALAQSNPRPVSQSVAVCDPKFPANCIKPNADGSLDVSGGGGGGGAVTIADGADVALGDRDDAAWVGSGASTAIAALKALYGAAVDTTPVTTAPQVGGAAAAGGAGAANANTLRTVAASDSVIGLDARATGGCTPYGAQSAASTNATNIKAAAGTLCGGMVINTTATLYYLRLYNLAAAPTCSSATGFVMSIPIPASATGAGTLVQTGAFGWAFTTGLGFCLTGGGGSTDNTNAATGVYVSLGYK